MTKQDHGEMSRDVVDCMIAAIGGDYLIHNTGRLIISMPGELLNRMATREGGKFSDYFADWIAKREGAILTVHDFSDAWGNPQPPVSLWEVHLPVNRSKMPNDVDYNKLREDSRGRLCSALVTYLDNVSQQGPGLKAASDVDTVFQDYIRKAPEGLHTLTAPVRDLESCAAAAVFRTESGPIAYALKIKDSRLNLYRIDKFVRDEPVMGWASWCLAQSATKEGYGLESVHWNIAAEAVLLESTALNEFTSNLPFKLRKQTHVPSYYSIPDGRGGTRPLNLASSWNEVVPNEDFVPHLEHVEKRGETERIKLYNVRPHIRF